jgi:hypothetical protein
MAASLGGGGWPARERAVGKKAVRRRRRVLSWAASSEQRAWKATKKMGSERGGGLPRVKSRQHGPRAARIRDRFFFLLLLLLLLLLNRHA